MKREALRPSYQGKAGGACHDGGGDALHGAGATWQYSEACVSVVCPARPSPGHAAMAPVLNGCRVRKEQTGFGGGLLLVQRTLKSVLRHALEKVWGVICRRVYLRGHRGDAQQVW